jgi:membrane protein
MALDLGNRIRRALRKIPAGRSLWRFGWAMSEHGAFRGASAMAFDAFLSLLPLLAIAGSVLRRFERSDVVFKPIFHAVPGPASRLADLDLLRLDDSSFTGIGPVSLLGFFWLASAGVATAMGVCETIFAANERPWLRRRVIAIGWVFAALAMIMFATTTTIAVSRATGLFWGRIIGLAVDLPVLIALLFAFFMTAIKRPASVVRRVWPGVLVTTTLWLVLTVAFSIYTDKLASYSLVYGGLASVAMIMIWLWLLALALLAGGEVNAQLEGVREYPPSTQVIGV